MPAANPAEKPGALRARQENKSRQLVESSWAPPMMRGWHRLGLGIVERESAQLQPAIVIYHRQLTCRLKLSCKGVYPSTRQESSLWFVAIEHSAVALLIQHTVNGIRHIGCSASCKAFRSLINQLPFMVRDRYCLIL